MAIIIRSAKQALAVADNTTKCEVNSCQRITQSYYRVFGTPDLDKDKDNDAIDGWLSEPKSARHLGDLKPPAGFPVAFKGGEHGHRAISRGGGMIRSTDFNGTTKRFEAGVLGNGTIAEVAKAMGKTYVGWSETIGGHPIPHDDAVVLEPAGPTPTYLDLTKALARLAAKSKSANATSLYLSARNVLGPLVRSKKRASDPQTAAQISAALRARLDDTSAPATQARLSAAIALLAPLS